MENLKQASGKFKHRYAPKCLRTILRFVALVYIIEFHAIQCTPSLVRLLMYCVQ